MAYTKQQLIDEAFGELALSANAFDITPEEQQTALRRLDTLMATWEQRGIRIGYVFPTSPETSASSADSGIPDGAAEPVFMNLAVRLAAVFGKQVSMDTKRAAREGFSLLLRDAAYPEQQQLPGTLPRGAGNRPYEQLGQPFFPQPTDAPLAVSTGGELIIDPE